MGSQLELVVRDGSLEFHEDLNVRPGQVKPTQVVGVNQSPNRTRSYEIQARNLCYKLVVDRKPRWQIWRRPCTDRNNHMQVGGNDGLDKYILRNVSCEARPGEILAIAGPSGAGKSTLLEVLAGRIKASSASHSLLVNDEPMSNNMGHYRRISGYVTQEDALFPLLTVEETLMFSARLRLPPFVPEADKIARLKRLLNELGLEQVSSCRIGNEDGVRGISRGERRRVSIGVDVIHDPAVLLLDEPTSGLDSAAALQVISMLKSMAQSHGRTLILSIHQPGFRILQHFNSILLLANGTVVHHGSLQMLERRLMATGHEIPSHVNVLEYAIDAIDCLESHESHPHGALAKQKAMTANGAVSHTHIDGDYKKNHTLRELLAFSADHEANGSSAEQQEKLRYDILDYNSNSSSRNNNNISDYNYNDRPSYSNSRLKEIMILTHRFSKNIFRTNQLFAARTLQALVAGFGLGTIFMKAGDSENGMQERIGFFAFSLTFLLSSTTEGLPIFLQERNILTRETSRGAYRVSSYVIANALVFLPFLLIVALLYATPVYWLVGLRREMTAFFYFALVVWMVIFMANSFVACFSALVPNFIMGNSLIAGFMGSFFLFSGYFISKENIPKYWIFMHYLSLFKYPFEAFLINEYSNSHSKCFERMYGECVVDGDGFLARQGLHKRQKWTNLAVMAIFIFAYRIFSFIILRFRCSRTRR